MRAVSFRSRCGIAPTSLIADCSSDIVRLGHAARLGACRARQVADESRWRDLRSTASGRSAGTSLKGDVTSCHLALQQQGSRDDAWQNASRRDARPSLGALGSDGWRTVQDVQTRTRRWAFTWRTLRRCANNDGVDFTLYWPEAQRWEGADFVVCVEQAGQFNDGRSIPRNFGTGSRKGCGRGSGFALVSSKIRWRPKNRYWMSSGSLGSAARMLGGTVESGFLPGSCR